jgi:hypothetical protein
MTRAPKRPRDLNQWAKRMVDIATGEATDREPTPEEQGKDPAREPSVRWRLFFAQAILRCLTCAKHLGECLSVHRRLLQPVPSPFGPRVSFAHRIRKET